MDSVPFGKTDLQVSVAGLGCGGSSRLGQSAGKSVDHSVSLVRAAFDAGVNFFDTAQVYGTEPIVGQALEHIPRDQVVISSKFKGARGSNVLTAAETIAAVDHSLNALRTDYIDVFNLHAVVGREYDLIQDHVLPTLLREQEKGKIRHIGITESSPRDLNHDMLTRAIEAPEFGAIAIAYNMMNQHAGRHILPKAHERGIGTVIMFAVRAVFSIPGRLQRDVKTRVDAGELPAWMAEVDNPLDFLLHPEGAATLIDAAYRYVRHKAFCDVILFGTGDLGHLQSNVASIASGPLPEADIQKLETLFEDLVGFGCDFPEPTS
ncbi:aldo/keto reductase [Planktotalea sp.]|uniref:aldo/keto reductase n=1 Tax=Planktotalea sp. TaxID=2029877 RepID=UPI00329A4650